MDKKIAPSSRIEALEKIRDKHSGNDAGTQTKRLLEAMQTLGAYQRSRRTATLTYSIPRHEN